MARVRRMARDADPPPEFPPLSLSWDADPAAIYREMHRRVVAIREWEGRTGRVYPGDVREVTLPASPNRGSGAEQPAPPAPTDT